MTTIQAGSELKPGEKDKKSAYNLFKNRNGYELCTQFTRRNMTDNNGWKIDNAGRRYRVVGQGCIEYAGTLETTRGVIDADAPKRPAVWHDYSSAHEIKRSPQATQSEGKKCPLKIYKRLMYSYCDSNCAFNSKGSCMLGSNTGAAADTAGRDCPFAGNCSDQCALYNSGCLLIQKGAKHD